MLSSTTTSSSRARAIRRIEEIRLPRARSAEQSDLAPGQAARDEAQNFGTRSVQPGQVVENDEQRLQCGRLTKQHERRVRHDEPARWGAFGKAERDVERIPMDRLELRQ